jgi:hypothetical protein
MGCHLVENADHYAFVIVAFDGLIVETERNAVALQLAVLITGFQDHNTACFRLTIYHHVSRSSIELREPRGKERIVRGSKRDLQACPTALNFEINERCSRRENTLRAAYSRSE